MSRLSVIKTGLAVSLAISIASFILLIAAQLGANDHLHADAQQSAKQDMGANIGTRGNEVSIGDLAISNYWARMSFGHAVNSAGFLTIANGGKADDVLIGASSPISKRTELHTHIREGNVMKMRRVEGGIELPAGKLTALAPGGYHIMFIGLEKPLAKGDQFPLTLTFKKAGKITLTMTARKMIPRGSHNMMMEHGDRGSHKM